VEADVCVSFRGHERMFARLSSGVDFEVRPDLVSPVARAIKWGGCT
jgi:hypothetical protein